MVSTMVDRSMAMGKIKENYSWARRNRRYVSSIYMPSLYSEGLGNLTFAIDTSGSIEDDELQEMLSEIQGIQQVFNPETMKIIDCDSTIHEIHEIDQSTDIMSLKFHGGGGTSFQPVLNYVNENPTQALIYFTDLEGDFPDHPPGFPMLWITTVKHDVPFGEVTFMEGIIEEAA